MKTTRVEILVIIAIVGYPVSWVLRITYGRQWLAWEYNLIESWGINQLAYFLAKTGLLIGIASFFLIRQKRKQTKDASRFYELPK
jgi:hypothetical protein